MTPPGSLFADVADALRKVGEKHGYTAHVSTNTRSITLAKPSRSIYGGSEEDYHVKVRRVPRGL